MVLGSPALEAIALMHETRCVTNESIVAWWTLARRHFPTMNLDPEKHEVDLVRAAALWMRLTEQGRAPEFPFAYRSALRLPSLGQQPTARPDSGFGLGLLLTFLALGALAVHRYAAVGLGVVAAVTFVLGYRRSGGAKNPGFLAEDGYLFRTEGRRVFEWHRSRSVAIVPAATHEESMPDFGCYLATLSSDGSVLHYLYGIPLTHLSKTDTEFWTSDVIAAADGTSFEATVDFSDVVLKSLAAHAPEPAASSIRAALNARTAGQTVDMANLRVDLVASLGQLHRSDGRAWRPLVVRKATLVTGGAA